MNIEELRDKKKQFETEIHDSLLKFEQETTLQITEVQLTYLYTGGMGDDWDTKVLADVNIKVEV